MKNPNSRTVCDFIKRNFQTITRFADLAKLNEADVRKILKRVPGPALGSLLDQAKRAVPLAKDAASYELKPTDADAVRLHIAANYEGNASGFVRQHKLAHQTLAQVLAGTRKRRSPLVVQIMKAAQVEGY